jgi:hypothetical protein
VTRLLALHHLSVEWHPIEVQVSQSGDLAFLTGSYERRFDDASGVPVSDRGRRLEMWRKQPDGSWKCFVDTWKLDPPVAVPSVAALESGPPAPVPETASKYGAMPIDYEKAMQTYFLEHLKHPESVQYQAVTQPEQGYLTKITGGLLMRETRQYGWTVKATINAKDSRNSYVGFKTYTFLFRGEKIVDARLPLPADEMSERVSD